jgi:DNA-binding transcriptional LysR family regulator
MDFAELRDLLKGSHPSLQDLLRFCAVVNYFEEHKSDASVKRAADEMDMQSPYFYEILTHLHKRLGIPPTTPLFVDKQPSELGKELAELIGQMVPVYRQLRERSSKLANEMIIRLGGDTVLAARLLPGMLRSFDETIEGDEKIRYDVVAKEPFTLQQVSSHPDLDLILVSHPTEHGWEGWGEQGPIGEKARFKRCLLCRFDSDLASDHRRGVSITKDRLANYLIVVGPNFPLEKVPLQARRTLHVETYFEAHGHVLASRDAITLSCREFLSEEEEKYLTAPDITELELGETEVGLFRSPRAYGRRSTNAKEKDKIDKLVEKIQNHLKYALTRSKTAAEKLTPVFQNRRFVYHTSVSYPPGGSEGLRWFRDEIRDMEVIPRYGGEDYFVKATHYMMNNAEYDGNWVPELKECKYNGGTWNLRPYRIFGRWATDNEPKDNEPKMHHVVWREIDPGPEHGAVSFTFEDRVISDKTIPIIGLWIGISSWSKGVKPLWGAYVLHEHSDLTGDTLNSLVKNYFKNTDMTCPRLPYSRARIPGPTIPEFHELVRSVEESSA